MARASLSALYLAAAVLLFLAAACGSDDEPTDTPTPAGTPSPEPATPTPEPGLYTGPGVTETEIRFGMTNDVSGEGGTPYAPITTAIQAYLRKVNDEDGGVCDRTVRLLVRDDSYHPDVALEMTRRLVQEDNVLGIIGGLGREIHEPVARYLNDPDEDEDRADGVPDLFVANGWPGWSDPETFPWTVGYIPDYQTDAALIAEYIMREFPDSSVGLLYQDDFFGQAYEAELTARLPETQLAGHRSYPMEEANIDEDMEALRQIGAEVVVLASTPGASADAVHTALEWEEPPQIIVAYVNATGELASKVGGGTNAEQLLEGFRLLEGTVLMSYLLSVVQDENRPEMEEHRRIMEEFQGPTPSSLTVYGQSVAELLIETLERSCDNLSRGGVLQSALSIQGLQTSLLQPGIEINLSNEDRFPFRAMQPIRIEADGRLEKDGDIVSVEEPAVASPTPQD